MPRPERITLGGYVYHVLNRANGRLRIFRKESDFLAFEKILADGTSMFSMRLCGYCIMGNHWHLLVWPRGDDDLSSFMRWVTLTHVQRYHTSHATVGIGHLYQGRYKSFPVQSDPHYLSVLRYIEANPLRAGLVAKASLWPWSSFSLRQGRESLVTLSDGPVELPSSWTRLVGEVLSPPELEGIGTSIRRASPFGDAAWIATTALRLKLQSTLRPRGRPRKST
ncbi:MAG TPA: transposase [Sedimentisphaerales bacterium]|jgi:putative transposase|nr:transposase [Sedimentisphaerales bacterium]